METAASTPSERIVVHPPIVRITHWINVIAMFIMIGSGWRIYNDSPLFQGYFFPYQISLGGDPGTSYVKWQDGGAGGALQWHFAGMWLLVLNGLTYVSYGLLSGRFRSKLLPVAVSGIRRDLTDALRFRLAHEVGVYNHVQRILYIGVLLLGVLIVASGLAIWKPVQFQTLAALFYDFQTARWVHFWSMAGIVLFILVHVTLAILVPSTLLSMITGWAPRGHHSKASEKPE